MSHFWGRRERNAACFWGTIFLIGMLLSGLAFAQPGDVPLPKPAPSLGLSAAPAGSVDPTENVKALNEAASKRQDDLRAAQAELFRSELKGMETLDTLRAHYNEQLWEASIARVDAEMRLRADYNLQLSLAEAKRIDAIRAVDVNAVSVAAQRSADQANVLATQVATSAEALRSLVATTAATVAASQQQLANTLTARLSTLEQASYQQAGQQKLQDPAFSQLVTEVRALTTAQNNGMGRSEGSGNLIGYLVSGASLLVSFLVLLVIFFRPKP